MTLLHMKPSNELVKAYLFLRTADSAVANLNIQIASTKAFIQWNSLHGYYSNRMNYQNQLGIEERDLKLWKVRLLEGQVGFVEWAACRAMGGKRLPPEILESIRKMLISTW